MLLIVLGNAIIGEIDSKGQRKLIVLQGNYSSCSRLYAVEQVYMIVLKADGMGHYKLVLN